MNKYSRILAVVGLAATLGACAPTAQTIKPSSQGNGASASGSEQGQANAMQGQGEMSSSQLNNPASPLSKRTIYFAFNSSAIAPQYTSIISAHAKYLSMHPTTTIKLEGNTDDRGSHTYNMALGQRRALAVAKLMELQGVQANQIDIISYGEDNPVCLQQNESCWKENRRVNIVYPGQPAMSPGSGNNSSGGQSSQDGTGS